MKPLLCVFAHPDDESFGPGGTIAKYANDRDVFILCATCGDAADSSIESEKLATIRRKELLESATVLGVKKVEFFDFKDGNLCNNLYHKLADKIQEKLEYYQPDTILTFEPKGVSGHIDHITVSLVTTFVFKKLSFIKTLLYYCQIKEIMKQYKDYFIYMPPGYDESETNMAIDVTDVWDKKVKAMRTHLSQKKDAQRILNVLSKFPKKEFFLKLEK